MSIINNKFNFEKIISLLNKVFKPARYLGIEPNSINKFNTYNKSDKYKFCICYPDLYEIGMSNISIKIIYFLINKYKNFICERVFLPDDDLIDLLKKENIPLFSLETWNFLNNFNMLGFSIHTELTYTNILKILEISKINILRKERDNNDPIIIAGGSNILNPFPLSNFVDLFFIGEFENLLPKILAKDFELIKNGESKENRIKILSNFEGIFNPEIKNKTKKVFVLDINKIFSPTTDFIPLVKPIQDRPSVEISRGCVNGCRFCQAGYYYRPYREKSPEVIINQIIKIIKNTGYEEINLNSLSVADYSNIIPLLKILEKLSKYNISISVPSLRIISFPPEILDSLKIVRKSGLTFAIEAGTEEIRNKINKDFSEDKLFHILEQIERKGWNTVKFYFIIGFPDIIDEEVHICNLLLKINKAFPRLKINANISLLIPKAKTPFEKFDQLSIDNYLNKCSFIKKNLSKIKNINLKFSDPYKSYFEYYFSQADSSSSNLLIEAVKNNKFREAWDEHFDKDFWKNMFIKHPLKKADFSLIDIGINNKFFENEINNYYQGIKLKNCINNKCLKCGICKNKLKNITFNELDENEYNKLIEKIDKIQFMHSFNKSEKIKKYIFIFNKYNLMKYIGHIDFYTLTYRLLKKAGIEFSYSKGYNPMPKISFPFPAPIYFETFNDIFIIETYSELIDINNNFKNSIKKINKVLPKNFKINRIIEIENEILNKIRLDLYYLINIEKIIEEKKLKDEFFKLLNDNYFKENYFIFDTLEKNEIYHNNNIKRNLISKTKNKKILILKFKNSFNIKENLKNPFKNFNNEIKSLIEIKRIFDFKFD